MNYLHLSVDSVVLLALEGRMTEYILSYILPHLQLLYTHRYTSLDIFQDQDLHVSVDIAVRVGKDFLKCKKKESEQYNV